MMMETGRKNCGGTKRQISLILSVLLFIGGVLGVMGSLMISARADLTLSASTWNDLLMGVGTAAPGTVYITVTADLTISGSNAHNTGGSVVIDLGGHTINGNGSQQAFWNESGTLTIKNGTIQDCRNDRGGAINNRASMTLENVTIRNCTGNIEAGAIMNYGTLKMTGGKITNCNGSRGGAIRIRPFGSSGSGIENSATATLTNVEISNNACDGRQDSGDGRYGRGGGIAVTNGTLTMSGCTVSGNKSTDDDGGGIDFDASGKTLTLTNTVFSNNQVTQSDRQGGGINLERGNAVITGCAFTGNTAAGEGGGINLADSFGTAVISDTTITGNTAKDHTGGGIMNRATLTLKGANTITGNTAKEGGAGVFFSYYGKAMNIEGKLQLSGNDLSDGSEDNLFLCRTKILTMTGKLDSSSRIGVSPEDLSQTPTVITTGASGRATAAEFFNDSHWITETGSGNEIQMRMSEPLSGDVLDKVTVSFHPAGQHSGLCIRDNGGGAGQNVVHLFNLGDSFRFWLTKADDDSYYIDFFGGADDYTPSNKRLDLSDKNGYGNVGNVVHVVMGNKTDMNKRWRFYRNEDGTYYIQNKKSGLYWDLENDNFDDKNKLCQRRYSSAQKWQMEIVHADADSGSSLDDQIRFLEVKQYDSFNFRHNEKTVQGNNWMSCLPDDVLISDLSIPGTHDAGTQHTWPTNSSGQCQQLSIMDQMNNGVRYFDLRLGDKKEDGLDSIHIVHKTEQCWYKGDALLVRDVMKWIYHFLDKNPGEVVILQPMANVVGWGDYDTPVYEYFREEVRKNQDRFYIGNHMPTLGEARGKILIISRIKNFQNVDYHMKTATETYPDGKVWGIDASPWYDWSGQYDDPLAKTADTPAYQVWTQDQYQKVGDDKWKIITNSIFNKEKGAVAKHAAAKAEGKNAWVVSYTSCVRIYPQNSARTLNPKLKNKLMTDPDVLSGQYLGVVCSDFTDQQLAYLVYKQNFITKQEKPHTEHTPETRVLSTTATCTQPGTRVVETYCSVCGQLLSTKSEVIPALGHDWCDPEYTWVKNGDTYRVTATHICDRDTSHTESETVQATPGTATAATCETPAQRIWYAEFTNEGFGVAEMQADEGEPLGHNWGEWKVVTPATTAAEGLERRTCTRDASHVMERAIPKLKTYDVYYVFQAVDGTWTEPTAASGTVSDQCTENGYTPASHTPAASDYFTVTGYSVTFRASAVGRTAYSGGSITISSYSGKLYVYYARNQYDLRFYQDMAGTRVWKTEKVYYGAPLSSYEGTVVAPPTGYYFAGWAETSRTDPYNYWESIPDDDTEKKQAGMVSLYPYILYGFSDTMPADTKNLYPVLISLEGLPEQTYTITFDANGGKFSDGTTTKTYTGVYHSRIAFPEDPTKENEAFQQWSTDQAVFSPPSIYMPRENRTYWARWHTHTPAEAVKENEVLPTCEEDGSYDLVIRCRLCKKVMSSEHHTVNKTGHAWSKWIFTDDSYHIRYCLNDASHVEEKAHGWGQGAITREATCQVTGVRSFTCEDCGAKKTQTIPLTGHHYVLQEGSTEATCTQPGMNKWECSVCGSPYEEISPATGHTWDEGAVTTAAGCEIRGVMTYTCVRCGAAKTEGIPALGHEWDSWTVVKQATDTEDGEEISVCRRDASHTQTQVIPRMIVTPPTPVTGLNAMGSPQTLINPGTATGGDMEYAIGTETDAPASGWNSSLPTGTKAGTYYVWYRVKGDDRYAHKAPAGPVVVTISEEPFSYMIYHEENTEHTVGDGLDAVICIRRSLWDEVTYDRFTQTLLDGAVINPADYSTSKGSLILTLRTEWLDTLAAGEHSLQIDFSDGSVQTVLKIKKEEPAPKQIPRTGDSSTPLLWMGLVALGLLGLGIGGLALAKKRQRSKTRGNRTDS